MRLTHKIGSGLFSIVLALAWAASVDAKNCSGPNCLCGDTLIANWTMPLPAREYYCPNVDQALKVAKGITLDCRGSWVTSNFGRDNAAGFRLLGGYLINCWSWDGWEMGVKLDANGSGMWYGGVGGHISQEGIHASHNTSGHVIEGVQVVVPQEALYFQGSHHSVVRNSYFTGAPATYANDGASGNRVQRCTLRGGVNRAIFSNAGPENWWEANDYGGGRVKSVNGSDYPNYIGPSPNATIQNTDGSLYVYQ